ncbi:MAG: MopE-related protein [Myxococcota bacterium]
MCSGGWPDDDCDDTAPEIFTGAPEFCSGSDDDCDGTIDEAAAVADDCAEGSCELGCRVRRSRDLGSSSACGISGAMDAVSCWGDIPGPFTAGAGAVHTTLTLGTDAERAWAPVSIGLTGAEVVARNPFAACAVLADRTLRCWGHNDVAALGVGDFALRRAPVTPPGLSEVIDVAVGPFTVCALQADGEVYCWGDTTDIEPGFANFARLGQPTSAVADPRRPTRVPSLERIVELENSGELFCARRYDGVVFCWGGPPIGDGSDVASEVPVRVVGASPALGLRGGLGFPGSGFFAPEQLMCAELTTGWQCWGSAGAAVGHGSTATASEPSPLTAPSDAPVDLSPGFVRSCAVLPGGGVECWGQDGDGSFTRPSAATAIETEGVAIAGVTGATSIVCGGTVCCVETAVDTRCFGEPASPTFGDGLARDGSVPTTHFGAADVATLAAGTAHLCVLETPSGATQGTVRCGGRASRGNLGIGSSDDHLRVTSTALTDAVSVDITRDRSCALRAGGGVSCWGAGAAGDAADTVDADVPLEVDLSGLGAASVSQVATGDTFSCLRDAGGAVRCWGSASALCGAAGSTCLQPGAPVDARRYDEVAAGEGFACARDGGRVYCWGSQSSGRLGNGLTASGSVTTPTLVAGLTDAVELALGDDHACARRATGAVACWGENGQSQLGDGGTSDRGTVEDVSGVSGATALRCGVGSCLARVAGGAWVGWGEDAATLGAAAGSSTRTAVPAAHAGTYLDLAIAAGTVCGLEAGGTVACWGRESSPAQDMRGLPPFSSP